MGTTFIPSQNSLGYVALPVSVDPNANIKRALTDIMAQIPGWVPREGHLDVAIIEECAQMMAETASVASQMAPVIFMYYGQLVGINPIPGAFATVPVTFTMRDTLGYTIPIGSVVAYPLTSTTQILFSLQSPVTVPVGATTGSGTLVCQTVGVFANDLPATTCQMVTTNASVASVATTADSDGGVDAETVLPYMDRLAAELRLLAPRPIIASDYAAMAANVTGVYRALAIDGLNPGRKVTDGVLNSSTTITSATAAFVAANDNGRPVTGTGIPSSTTMTVVNPTTATISHAATATATGVTLTFGDLTGQERYVTVSGVDIAGAALSPTVNGQMQAYLASKREVNFVVGTVYPTFTGIDVTVTCDAIHGASTGAVQTAITAALTNFLNPATWGGGQMTPPQWIPTSNVVRFLDIANVIRTTPGVLYIPSGSLTACIHLGTPGTSDITLPGDAPLPTASSLAVTVVAT